MKGILGSTRNENALAMDKADRGVIENLARKAAAGDREALIGLCRAIAKGVLFRVSCRLRNPMDAEDAAQEVLIRVCSNIQGLDDPKAFSGWLNSIIINETNRYFTKNSKHSSVLDIQDYLDAKVDEDEDFIPQGHVLNNEDRAEIMEIVKALPERQLEAVLLHYYDGLNVTETAKAMDLERSSVSHYLILARNKIKAEFEKQMESGGLANLSGLAALPIGSILSQAFEYEAGLMSAANSAWVQQAIGSAGMYAGGGASSNASAGTTADAGVKIVAAVVAVSGIFGGIMAWQAAQASADEPEGSILFSGGSAVYEHYNPTHAEAHASLNNGELTTTGWTITTMDGGTVLYSGAGASADEALAGMRARGEDGEYMLVYTLEDPAGEEYMLSSNFYIESAG